jgi:N-acetyl-1-D-myo-inositol-2-amino-2-deoxy-alpha-D-glucopyranoside deacetylase
VPDDETLGLLCVHAHPDDEAMTTGGILARYAEEGMRTAVVTCTAGERGEVRLPGADVHLDRPALGELRTRELARALDLLGAGPPRLLGYADSGNPAGNHADAFWNAPFDEAVGRLVGHVRVLRPDVVVTYDADGLYGHPDHLQAHRVTLAAVEAAASERLYPKAGAPWVVSKLYLATFPHGLIAKGVRLLAERGLPDILGSEERPVIGIPDEQVTTVVDVRPWLDRKWEALRAHESQLGPGSLFRYLPEELRAAALGVEWFRRVGAGRALAAAAGREDDLFAGLRR